MEVNKEEQEPKKNIFGLEIAVDDSMETEAPSLEMLSEDEKPPEQVSFNPFSENVYSSDTIMNEEVPEEKEEIETFSLDDEQNNENTSTIEVKDFEKLNGKNIPYNADALNAGNDNK